MLINLILVLISQCICILNYHAVYLKYAQFYLSIIPQLR